VVLVTTCRLVAFACSGGGKRERSLHVCHVFSPPSFNVAFLSSGREQRSDISLALLPHAQPHWVQVLAMTVAQMWGC
jgi:hypothetical protein